MNGRLEDLIEAERAVLDAWCAVANCQPQDLTRKERARILRVVYSRPSVDRTPDTAIATARLLGYLERSVHRAEYEQPNWSRSDAVEFAAELADVRGRVDALLAAHKARHGL